MSPNTSLGDQTGRFSTLTEIAQLLSSSLDIDVVLQRVMDVVVAVTGAERGFILLINPQSGELETAVARNLDREEIDRASSGISRTLCEQVARGGEGVLIADALSDQRTAAAQSVFVLRLRSVLCAPLRVKGRTVGVVYLDHRMATSRFTQQHLHLLKAVGEQAAIAIENARLYDDLKRHAQQLADMKAYQDDIFRSVSTAIIGIDLQGRVASLNRSAEDLLGTREAGARGGPYYTLLGETLSARLLKTFAGAAQGRISEGIQVSATLRGAEHHLRCAVSPLRDGNGGVKGVLLLAEDVTARVLAERAREREEAERRRIRDLFGRYVAEPLVEQLVADPSRAQLGGERREVTLLFADIRGYTTLSEMSTPEELVAVLSRYLTVATDTIMEQGGTLDKFMGDGVMAIFNAPLDQPDHALAAVRSAWLMQQRSREELEDVTFGVGLNTGEALVGNFGTERFRNYSCVGDAVNVASRLQANAPGGEVLLSSATLALVQHAVRVQPLGALSVKGRMVPVETYRLLEVLG